MNVFFLMMYFIDETNRNNTKLSQQMESVAEMGHNVYYIGLGNDGIYLCHNGEKDYLSRIHHSRINLFYRIQMCNTAYKALNKQKIDFAYVRSMTAVPSFVKVLKRMKKKRIKVVVEIPTYPDYEEANNERRLSRKVAKKMLMPFEKKATMYVDLYTLIGEKASFYHGRKAINISNGIDVRRVRPWNKKGSNQNQIHLIALGNFCYWHGYERLIEGLYEYNLNNGEKEVFFHLVGPDKDGSLKNWEELAKTRGVDKNVILEGSLYGETLDKMFDACDFAISSLGEYKKGLSVDSALKSLNYMARGIPFMHTGIAYEAEEITPFTLKVPNDSTVICIDEIIDKIDYFRKHEYGAKVLRDYCANNCTWREQFTKVFSELNKNEDYI